jgi:SAM-dependent methyltransferase
VTTVDLDAQGWPDGGERFDLVWATETLASAEDPAAILERVVGLLAPDGVAILGLPEGDRGGATRRVLADNFASVRYAVQGSEPDARLVAVAFSSGEDQSQRWLDLLDQQWQLLAQLDAELEHTRAWIGSMPASAPSRLGGPLRALRQRLGR